jgi:hypothetical protein
VPTATGETADLTRYPARRGFEDLVLLVSDADAPFAWTAVSFPKERFVWFGLKDPRVLRQTIFWISNGGRHYPPWSGRHVNVMGLEEVTSWFHLGLAESAAPNRLADRDYPTTLNLNAKQPVVIPYIMGIAELPAGFDRVMVIAASSDNQSIAIKAANGKAITASVNLDFLKSSAPADAG